MVQRLANKEIYSVFTDLWERKTCSLPFTKEDFKEWCSNPPLDTTALVLVDGKGDIYGGVIFYPTFLPRALFVQLMIIMNAYTWRMLEKPVAQYARRWNCDKILFASPSWLVSAMQRLFEAKEIGRLFERKVKGD